MTLGGNGDNMDDLDMGDDPYHQLEVGTDGTPSFYFCQPCEDGSLRDFYNRRGGGGEDTNSGSGSSNSSGDENFARLDPILPPITEDQPLDERESELVREDRERHVADLQALYRSSRRQPQQPSPSASSTGHVSEDDGDVGDDDDQEPVGVMELDSSDPLLQELEAQAEADAAATGAPEWWWDPPAPEAPKWWDAAERWCPAFGVTLDSFEGRGDGRSKGDAEAVAAGIPTSSKATFKSCIGHKEVIYSVSFSQDGKYLCTASQDSTVGIWDAATHRLVTLLKGHNIAYECLRVDWAGQGWADEVLDRAAHLSTLVASSGADGTVKVWACADPKIAAGWKCEYTLDHAALNQRGGKKEEDEGAETTSNGVDQEGEDDLGLGLKPKQEDDKPQVYALQFIDNWRVFTQNLEQSRHKPSRFTADGAKNSFLMTSSDEFIHLWEVVGHPFDQQLQFEDQKIRLLAEEVKLKEVMSLHFGRLEEYGYGVTACSVTGEGLQLPPPPTPQNHPGPEGHRFGGERNPDSIVYVFDASYCPANGMLGVALSDGTLRLVNGRGICVSVLSIPGAQSHLTSFCWDKAGGRLATCVASGHLITWALDMESHGGGSHNNTVATCTAIFEGGHQAGRPLYGCQYCGDNEDLLMSWGVDGKLCLWDSSGQGNFYAPIAVLKNDDKYPIFAVHVSDKNVAVGGGSDGGFIGIPLYLYDVPNQERTADASIDDEIQNK